jgi:hypothetical protein
MPSIMRPPDAPREVIFRLILPTRTIRASDEQTSVSPTHRLNMR